MGTIFGLGLKPASRVNHVGGSGFNDPKLNQMMTNALRANDAVAAYRKIGQYITQQAYFLPVLVTNALVYVNTKKIQGVTPFGKAFRYANDLGTELDWSPAK
jgi:ABC-type oligopeptide transport system substrate-binding subunit